MKEKKVVKKTKPSEEKIEVDIDGVKIQLKVLNKKQKEQPEEAKEKISYCMRYD